MKTAKTIVLLALIIGPAPAPGQSLLMAEEELGGYCFGVAVFQLQSRAQLFGGCIGKQSAECEKTQAETKVLMASISSTQGRGEAYLEKRGLRVKDQWIGPRGEAAREATRSGMAEQAACVGVKVSSLPPPPATTRDENCQRVAKCSTRSPF